MVVNMGRSLKRRWIGSFRLPRRAAEYLALPDGAPSACRQSRERMGIAAEWLELKYERIARTRSPDAEKRNPGLLHQPTDSSRIALRSIRATGTPSIPVRRRLDKPAI